MAHLFARSLSEHSPPVICCESTMIVAWVLSLLTLLSMLVMQLERLAALEVISVNTYAEAQKRFIAAEQSLLECERHLSSIAALDSPNCYIQSAGKNLWRISSTTKPSLEILVFMDEKIASPTRINWRQNFE